MHGFTDYPYIATVSIAPKLFGFENEEQAALMCRILSSTIIVSSVFTRSEWGLIRVMPYKAHLVIDVLGGVASLAAPWLLGFAHNRRARNTFIAMGIVGLSAGLLSQPVEMKQRPKRGSAIRSLRALGVR